MYASQTKIKTILIVSERFVKSELRFNQGNYFARSKIREFGNRGSSNHLLIVLTVCNILITNARHV